MARGPDAATLLARAVAAAIAPLGAAIVEGASERWASATFVGARHRLVLAGDDHAAVRAWLAALPEAEWSLRGHLVADAQVVANTRCAGRFGATIEILTVEER